ncbi:hypothetical protein [Candidatus Pantoea multigeneris]|uniref:Uncharacterized protein n=1 Tax=Candidatus Pantoea multigeneris TaxID=2608357 RepID=A0ABX0RCN3_9GAMM|nr:hypothetical protein [Pantoea multigeneris]NIF23115.1 hypothetical protein [Pantoea multigeneris]
MPVLSSAALFHHFIPLFTTKRVYGADEIIVKPQRQEKITISVKTKGPFKGNESEEDDFYKINLMNNGIKILYDQKMAKINAARRENQLSQFLRRRRHFRGFPNLCPAEPVATGKTVKWVF